MASINVGLISAGCRYESLIREIPSISANCGSISSIALIFPKSFPYEVVFSLTKKISLTPLSANHLASLIISSCVRETKAPRKNGIAQKVQRRSHPAAIFNGATGALSNLFLRTRSPSPILVLLIGCLRSAGAMGSNLRRSLGAWA